MLSAVVKELFMGVRGKLNSSRPMGEFGEYFEEEAGAGWLRYGIKSSVRYKKVNAWNHIAYIVMA